MKCPHCSHDLMVEKGRELGSQRGAEKRLEKGEDLDSGFSLSPNYDPNPNVVVNPNRARVRGKALEYSDAFSVAWRAYGRGDEKQRAYLQWLLSAQSVGGEARLLPLVLGALKWQAPNWAVDGWKFAPYFERYLKRRKWEDERPPIPTAQTSPSRVRGQEEAARRVQATDAYIARQRQAEARRASPEEVRRAREEVRRLAQGKSA